jgi:minor extracellular serine protease Vpr
VGLSRRVVVAVATGIGVLATAWSFAIASPSGHNSVNQARLGHDSGLPKGFEPAMLRAQKQLGRYFVVMRRPSVAQRLKSDASLSARSQKATAAAALRSQAGAIGQARAAGGRVIFRYKDLIDGFSANLSPNAAAALARRGDVASVRPVSIVQKSSERGIAAGGAGQSVSFIGAPKVWDQFHAQGQGITVADVDTGVDYTHKNFGGPGTVAAYNSNNPNFVEHGTFPTKKVIAGYDLVGSNYDVLDDDTSNDIPHPDADPLDRDGHGSHTSGSCCGNGVPGKIGKGVAPKSKLYAIKVWDVGNSTDDVLVAGYERAMDPNDDGNIKDAADVMTFSGGVDYGNLNSVEARAAQRVVNMGTVFVAAQGNAGNQPTGGSAYIGGTPGAARGVISVAASISAFNAQSISVDTPATSLPDNGLMVHQDWSGAFDSDITDQVIDAREFDPPADPANPDGTDQELCTPTADSFAGHIALIFKASSTTGDCTADIKVANAEAMGAGAVILWNGFGGLPSQLGIGSPPVATDIPAVMLSTNDSDALANVVSPDAAGSSFNTVPTTVTLHSDTTEFPEFRDAMTDFTSEGPARLTSDLKPDISAPGSDILSTAVGTGDQGLKESGTSMATPHVAGVAALLRQIHPTWSVARIKAVMMDQATRNLKNNDLSTPAPATEIGAGRVRADQAAEAHSLAQPGSLSFGFRQVPGTSSSTRSFTVHNLGKKAHDYSVSGNVRYADFDPAATGISVSTNGTTFGAHRSFTLAPHGSKRVTVKLTLHPSAITEADQLDGWYYFNPNMDGTIAVQQTKHGADTLNVAWHVAPLAASDDSLSASSLDLSGGPGTMTVNGGGAGIDYADLYLLGDTDPVASTGEEDIVATGARSFTGSDVEDGNAAGVPSDTDVLGGNTWQEFLSNDNSPDDPVEFGVQTAAVHNTTETEEVDVLVDAGADGVFADQDLKADYMIVKQAAPGGATCVFDLSLPSPFDECAATYFPDYTNYNGNLFGLVVDASAIGLTNADPKLSYDVTACTGTFSGDVPGQICDTAGAIDDATGTYDATLNASDPALTIDPLVCGGFWAGGACDSGDPISVDRGSAGPSEDPSILALFPSNRPSRNPTVVTTSH